MDLISNNNLLTDLLDKALECPVCLEQLDSTARVLPCQHTFCRRCLLEIVHSRRELLCPECRIQCDIRVDDLPPNILLIRLLEGMAQKQLSHLFLDPFFGYSKTLFFVLIFFNCLLFCVFSVLKLIF
jgi:hypothetical protein